MLLYASLKRHKTIGGNIRYDIKTIKGIKQYLDVGHAYVLLIKGVVIIENGDPSHYFMPDDTPYIVWREEDSSKNQCFYMGLNLRNPNDCIGGNLSAEEAITHVTSAIKENGVSSWPTVDVEHNFKLYIVDELRERI